MKSRTILAAFAALTLALACFPAAAQVLYATSVRSFASGGSDKVVGSIYTINLANATATLVAPIRLRGESAVGITGIADHPTTGVLYGITSALSPVHPRSLVSINPANGDAELIGPLNVAGSDIAFDSHGTLFMWISATSQIATVDLSNATVHPIGSPGPAGTAGGIAIDAKGSAYVTPAGAAGLLDKIDTRTGALTPGPPLTGAPFPSGISAMTFTPSGLLLALNSNVGSPASVRLVAINTSTGVVSSIGSLPEDTDSIAFAASGTHDIRAALATMSGRTLALFSLILGLVLALAGVALFKLLRR